MKSKVSSIKKIDTTKTGAMKGKTTAFFRSSWNELKKVHWPSRKEIVTYTAVVLVSVAFVSMLIWAADSILSFLLEYMFKLVGKA